MSSFQQTSVVFRPFLLPSRWYLCNTNVPACWVYSVDHESVVAALITDPVFLHVSAGMTVVIEDGTDWYMAEVIWVDGDAKNLNIPMLLQVADVDTGDIISFKTELVKRTFLEFENQ